MLNDDPPSDVPTTRTKKGLRRSIPSCTRCRRRHVRCDGRPGRTCSNCARRAEDCSYPDQRPHPPRDIDGNTSVSVISRESFVQGAGLCALLREFAASPHPFALLSPNIADSLVSRLTDTNSDSFCPTFDRLYYSAAAAACAWQNGPAASIEFFHRAESVDINPMSLDDRNELLNLVYSDLLLAYAKSLSGQCKMSLRYVARALSAAKIASRIVKREEVYSDDGVSDDEMSFNVMVEEEEGEITAPEPAPLHNDLHLLNCQFQTLTYLYHAIILAMYRNVEHDVRSPLDFSLDDFLNLENDENLSEGSVSPQDDSPSRLSPAGGTASTSWVAMLSELRSVVDRVVDSLMRTGQMNFGIANSSIIVSLLYQMDVDQVARSFESYEGGKEEDNSVADSQSLHKAKILKCLRRNISSIENGPWRAFMHFLISEKWSQFMSLAGEPHDASRWMDNAAEAGLSPGFCPALFSEIAYYALVQQLVGNGKTEKVRRLMQMLPSYLTKNPNLIGTYFLLRRNLGDRLPVPPSCDIQEEWLAYESQLTGRRRSFEEFSQNPEKRRVFQRNLCKSNS